LIEIQIIMDATSVLQQNQGGFDFENVQRNSMLEQTGLKMPGTMKTGTTIVGLVYKDGVVLAADTRATGGSIVCDKNCEKIHYIADNIYCCGAGTSADTENTTNLIASQLELLRLTTGRQPRVKAAMTRLKQRLFGYQGHVSAALVLGGVDCTGAYLYTVYPHGSVDNLPFATMGSGSLAAMAMFESEYRDDMDEKSAIDLCDKAIQSGIFNDLGSGSNVDVCVITKDKVKYLRNIHDRALNKRKYNRRAGYAFPKNTTEWISETKELFKTTIEVSPMEA
jgi:20S proteasome subunit beta 2